MFGDGLRGQHEGELVFEVAFVHLCSHDFDGPLGLSRDGLEADIRRVFNFGDFRHDVFVYGSGDLAAVAPEHLVAVVFLGVVAGGDHDAGRGLFEADAVAEFRRGTQALEQVHLDAVIGEDLGRYFCEQAGIVAAVVADAHAGLSLHMGLDVVGEALGGHAHRVFVHAVGAGAHDAAQAAGAELQVAVEGVFQGNGIRVHQVFDLGLGLVIEVAGEPALCCLLVIFHMVVF